jgi:hypothetical protein
MTGSGAIRGPSCAVQSGGDYVAQSSAARPPWGCVVGRFAAVLFAVQSGGDYVAPNSTAVRFAARGNAVDKATDRVEDRRSSVDKRPLSVDEPRSGVETRKHHM